ncbi:MAG: IS200/IS605 family transposase [Methylacidiphilaceae bacterium]|nr:IS200/IS605 family transposase [Candidatus Methylacidiphilaceae bacterium]
MVVRYCSNRNVVFSCKDHVIRCPKFRRKVFREANRPTLKRVILDLLVEKNAGPIEMEVMPDPVHRLVGCDPQYGIHRLVLLIKGRMSALLRHEFPELRWGIPALGTNSDFVATVGGAPLAMVKQDIENQKRI